MWANDIDGRKEAVYVANFGKDHFVREDIAKIHASHLPTPADLAWASFPCQDLSLAGWQRGISAERSGTFWAFWHIMHDLLNRGQRPPIIVIENVTGVLYGNNFLGLCEALAALDMQFGALVVDAKCFVPQSRPRVFIVCVDSRVDCSRFTSDGSIPGSSPKALKAAYGLLNEGLRHLWRWWKLPLPAACRTTLAQVIEREPTGVGWHTEQETEYLLSMMSKMNRAKVEESVRSGKRHIGFLYRRMREGVQRAEVRFDGVSGCLRTPRGGSSRQTVVEIDKGHVRTRLLSPREAARLMGVEDTYILPDRYNDAYKAMGDGLVVPVVRYLSEHLLSPLSAHVREVPPLEPSGREQYPSIQVTGFRQSSERRAAEWLTSVKSKSVLSRD